MSTQLFTWGFPTFQVFRLRTWFYAAPTFMLFLMTPSRKHHGGNLAIHLIRLKKVPFCVFDISSWLVKSIYCNPLSWTTQRFSQAFTSNKHVKHHDLISYAVHSKLMVRFFDKLSPLINHIRHEHAVMPEEFALFSWWFLLAEGPLTILVCMQQALAACNEENTLIQMRYGILGVKLHFIHLFMSNQLLQVFLCSVTSHRTSFFLGLIFHTAHSSAMQ